MFRAAVLSIVVALAVGQNGAFLCGAWCHPAVPATAACQHQEASGSPILTGEGRCDTTATMPTAFVREDVQRTSPAFGPARAIVLTDPPAHRSSTGPARIQPPHPRPPVIALRV